MSKNTKASKRIRNQKQVLNQDQLRAKIAYEAAQEKYLAMEKLLILSKTTFPTEPSTDGYFHLNIKDSSKKSGRRQLTAKTLEELQEKFYLHEKKGSDGECKKTVKDIYELIQAEKLDLVKSQEKRLSVQNTVARNNWAYKRFFDGTDFERRFISDVTEHDIQSFIEGNLKRFNLKKKGFAFIRSILKQVFEKAFMKRWIHDNPYLRVDFKRLGNMLVDDVPIEDRAHSDDDLRRMMDYIHEKQHERPGLITPYALELQLITAMRRGEIPPLCWQDVHDDYLSIHQEMLTVFDPDKKKKKQYIIVGHTKTNRARQFPVTEELRDYFERLKSAHHAGGYDSKFLFPSKKNANGCITNETVYNFYYRMCKKLQIPTSKDITKGTHAFRRTRITEITNMSGGNLLMASLLLGNSPNVALSNYYTGINLEEAKRVLETRNTD